MHAKPRVVSLFSGAGGFDWGFHRAGFQTRLACELLKDAAATLAKNLQLTIILPSISNNKRKPAVVQGDIRHIDFSQIKLRPDVLIGGPPCQDFSMAQGQERPGLNGGRGKLYIEFIRTVMFLQPKVFVFENVPGLISSNEGLVYSTIISDITHLDEKRKEVLSTDANIQVPTKRVHGYEIVYNSIVDAVRLGVPQTRKRLFLIGIRCDLLPHQRDTKLHAIRSHLQQELSGGSMLFAKFPLTCMEVFEGKPLTALQDDYKQVMKEYRTIWRIRGNPIAAEWKKRVWDTLKFDVIKDYYKANQIRETYRRSKKEFQQAMQEHENLLSSLGWLDKPIYQQTFSDETNQLPRQTKNVIDRMSHIPPDENYAFVDGTEWSVVGKDISFIYRRAAPLKPAWTVMAYGGGGTYGYHYERGRAQLTLREKARIQTFTDDFLFEGEGMQIRAQIGEAVPPLLGERIAKLVLEILTQFVQY